MDTGPRVGRVDVVGVRDLGGGDLAARSEVVAVEVKVGLTSFAKSAGQAHGYSVMADRCYLAVGATSITEEQLVIAGQLGIGVLGIGGRGSVREILTAPLQQPIVQLRLQLLEKMHCAPCALCATIFKIGNANGHFANLVRRDGRDAKDMTDAVKLARGMVWWLSDERDSSGRATTYRRRYMCPDCAYALTSRASRSN